jgi:nickel/cobalt transporter (NicO) family protein
MGRPHHDRPHSRRRAQRGFGAAAALLAVLLLPAVVLAHPLGNFTINHYAGIRVEPDRVLLDIVIDQAEIPAFQSRLDFDTDEDGAVSDEESDAGRSAACTDLSRQLSLTAGAAALPLRLAEAGLSFPLGSTGLSTLRLVCGFSAALPAALDATAPTTLVFADTSYPDRLGWREIVVTASRAHVSALDGSGRATDTSKRLTSYPAELVATPLADTTVTVAAEAGGPTLPAWDLPDATPVEAASVQVPIATGAAVAPGALPAPAVAAPTTAPVALATAPAGAVPGGSGAELPSIFRTADLTPVVLLLSLATAAALGAGHALTPGHGKTLMAAYLVGTRGRPLHALGLGLSVSVSHTVGILVLAAIVVGAADILPPDLVVRAAPVVAAISILGIGSWMLLGEWRRRRSVAAHDQAHAAQHDRGNAHDHSHDDGPALDHHHDRAEHDGSHTHSGVRHSHLPPAGISISWRSLFVLGLAGGLIPSTSALLILLGSIAAGRPAYGFVLVVAFGVGMAVVLAGIGLAMVFARDHVDRLPAGAGVGRARDLIPLVAAVLVFGFGIYLTAQAVGGAPTL